MSQHVDVMPAPLTATHSDDLPGRLDRVVRDIGADELWERGITGGGVTVAVIDTGVAAVSALAGPGKVIAVVDLSLEGRTSRRDQDGFGHGTHLAGIIAGAGPGSTFGSVTGFKGVAPEASIVSVKVGDTSGLVDASQVIEGIDWVVAHRHELGIRVLNLSYGTDSDQHYSIDPVAAAVERAWRAGIVVVTSAGNAGPDAGRLTNPARDPFVIAVGAAAAGAGGYGPEENTSSGSAERTPDIAAPGRSIVSLRAPGSEAEAEHLDAHVGEDLIKGTGSSQAAAVVSGAVALLLSARPHLRPDEVKALLLSTAMPLGHEGRLGHGLIDVSSAVSAPVPQDAEQRWVPSDGSGPLDESRGSARRIVVDGTPIVGETTWRRASWRGTSWEATSWGGISWGSREWSGISWGGISWGSGEWSGISWGGISWGSGEWSGISWGTSRWT